MTREQFDAAIRENKESTDFSPELQALWYDAQGDWTTAHRIAQEIKSPSGSWIHAYLHRKEGDLGNAAYWYRNAGREPCSSSLDEEFAVLATQFCS